MRRLALIFAFVVAILCGCADDDPVGTWQVGQPDPIENAAETIQTLADAYSRQSYNRFETLLANDYTYFLHQPNPDTGETQYDRATELRIHQRMFDPENIPPVDPPLPYEAWLQQVTFTMLQQSGFVERSDLYTNAMPPGPLDPARWIASEATYGAEVFLQLPGDTDYQVNGGCRFVVIEDRTKTIGEPGKFAIYHWVDLDGATTAYRRLYR